MSHRIVVILVAVASLGATALIALTVMRSPGPRDAGPALVGGTHGNERDGLPVLVTLPSFTLTERTGQPLGLSDLRGRVWIANFIFTRCAGPCPMMTSRMAQMQFDTQDDPALAQVALVSFSVDPEHDTPAVLSEYARIAHAKDGRWFFLTGSRDAVWRLIRDGFKLPVGEEPDNTQMPIYHSQSFVLVDTVGRIRGFYRGIDETAPDGSAMPHERAELLRDARKLLEE